MADLEELGDGEVSVAKSSASIAPIRAAAALALYAGDVLVLQGDPTVVQPVVDQAKLKLLGAEEIAALKPRDKDDEMETVEAVIAPDSLLIGNTPQDLRLRQNYEINLFASVAPKSRPAPDCAPPLRAGRRRRAAGPAGQLDRALAELGCCRSPNATSPSGARGGAGCRC